jgi:L-ascorbate metabolism protein UlaG (beta-lactamase superfamily)
MMPGGNACGFVVTIPHHNLKIWHVGDTAIFSDMKLIDDLYTPDVALIPIGE